MNLHIPQHIQPLYFYNFSKFLKLKVFFWRNTEAGLSSGRTDEDEDDGC
jgi:hypothetical protein